MTKWALLFNLPSQFMSPGPWLSQQLDCLQFLHIYLEPIPKLDEVLWVCHSHPRRGITTPSQSAGHASLNVVICLVTRGQCWFVSNLITFPAGLLISPFGFQPLEMPRIILLSMHSFALCCVELHGICYPSPQIYGQVPLKWSSAFCHVRHFS